MTITPKEYTKHYYANGERLATSIGAGGWCHVSPDVITEAETYHEMYLQKEWINSYIDKEYPFEYPQEDRPILTENEDIFGNAYDEIQYVCPNRRLAQLKVDYSPDMLLNVMNDNCDVQSAEDDIFYRHSDHLGSASWITERHGDAIQYLHYMPYGQLLVNQMPYGYDERYKFTGKERDAETGYDYFGARYYAPSLLHWITVDPLADKYPHISPYAYCSWNPIKFVDPDGRIVVAASALSQKRLLSTLSCDERKYVSFDRNGNININLLKRSKSTSHNMTALKALAYSQDVTYNILVQEKSTNGKTDMKQAGGVAEMYGTDSNPSPDPSIVNIISGDHLNGVDAAENMAHEAFVHAYLYETNGHDGRAAGHQRPNLGVTSGDTYTDPNTGVQYPSYDINFENSPNDILNQYDMKARSEASVNYNCE